MTTHAFTCELCHGHVADWWNDVWTCHACGNPLNGKKLATTNPPEKKVETPQMCPVCWGAGTLTGHSPCYAREWTCRHCAGTGSVIRTSEDAQKKAGFPVRVEADAPPN